MPLPKPAVGKEMGNFYFQFELMGTKPGRARRALLLEQTISVGEEEGHGRLSGLFPDCPSSGPAV